MTYDSEAINEYTLTKRAEQFEPKGTWFVDVYINDELRIKYAGPFQSEFEAEEYALALTGDSSDFGVYEESGQNKPL